MRFFWVFKCCHLALWRQHDVVVRPCDGTGKLAEDDGLFWDRGVLFYTVVTVVHTNTHNFLWGQQRRQQLYVWPFHHTLTRIQGSVEAEKGIIPYTDWKKDTCVLLVKVKPWHNPESICSRKRVLCFYNFEREFWVKSKHMRFNAAHVLHLLAFGCIGGPNLEKNTSNHRISSDSRVCVTPEHSPDPCPPARAALWLLRAWKGHKLLDPPHPVPLLAPHLLGQLFPHPCCDETVPDAWLHHLRLCSLSLFVSEKINS